MTASIPQLTEEANPSTTMLTSHCHPETSAFPGAHRGTKLLPQDYSTSAMSTEKSGGARNKWISISSQSSSLVIPPPHRHVFSCAKKTQVHTRLDAQKNPISGYTTRYTSWDKSDFHRSGARARVACSVCARARASNKLNSLARRLLMDIESFLREDPFCPLLSLPPVRVIKIVRRMARGAKLFPRARHLVIQFSRFRRFTRADVARFFELNADSALCDNANESFRIFV